jgi:hypothetical protein
MQMRRELPVQMRRELPAGLPRLGTDMEARKGW